MSLQDQVDRINRVLQNTVDPNNLTANQTMPSGGKVVVVNPNSNELETIPEISSSENPFKGYHLDLSGIQASYPSPTDGDFGYSFDGTIRFYAAFNTWQEEQLAFTPPTAAAQYEDLSTMYAAQGNQELGDIYEVVDASDDPDVVARGGSSTAFYRYLGTTNGDLSDYFLLPATSEVNNITVEPKTGTAINFDKSYVQNAENYLLSGDLTIDLTDAVLGSVVVVYCDAYLPNVTGADVVPLSGQLDENKLNVLTFLYDGFRVLLNIGNGESSIDNSLLAFWDAFDNASVINSSGVVSQFNDQTRNDYQLIQNTNSLKPTYSDLDNKIIFDGISNSQHQFLKRAVPEFDFQQSDDFSILIKGIVFDVQPTDYAQHILNNKLSPSENQGWSINTSSNGQILYFSHHDGSTQNFAQFDIVSGIRDGVARDFVFINDAGVLKIYDEDNTNVGINGSNSIGAINYTGVEFKMGSRDVISSINPFKGSLQIVKVWNKALTEVERNTELGI
jgi:hypothetical protein